MSGGNGRRIFRLFRPYRLRLSWLLTMILFSAALGVVPPFLLRDLLNNVLAKGAARSASPRRGSRTSSASR